MNTGLREEADVAAEAADIFLESARIYLRDKSRNYSDVEVRKLAELMIEINTSNRIGKMLEKLVVNLDITGEITG